jgi:hypothetical protein
MGLTRQTSRHRRNERSHTPARAKAATPAPPIDLGPVELEPAAAALPADRRLDDERRMRAAGGPDDRAHYACSCGYAFEANVSTSVACPHCGAGQAW